MVYRKTVAFQSGGGHVRARYRGEVEMLSTRPARSRPGPTTPGIFVKRLRRQIRSQPSNRAAHGARRGSLTMAWIANRWHSEPPQELLDGILREPRHREPTLVAN